MKMNRLLGVLFVASCIPLVSLQAGLLVNGDFNSGDFSGWWIWAADPDNQSGAIEPGSGYSYNGTPNARLFSASNIPQMTLVQEFALTAGTPYSLSFVYSGRGATAGSAGISIDYYDAGLKWLGSEWISLYQRQAAPNADGQWLSYSGNFTSAGGTANASLMIKAADWTTVYFDNVDISIIPEPTTILLLGLGGLVLRRT
jgi:hypothetical protein